jgi:hypothetical protein
MPGFFIARDITAIIECDTAREFSITYRFTEMTMLCLLAGRPCVPANGLAPGDGGLSACPVAAGSGGRRFSKLALERTG